MGEENKKEAFIPGPWAVAEQAADLRKRLLALSGNLKEQTFDLATALVEAKKHWSQWGFNSFVDYAETELNIKARKARYLVRIVETCAAVGLAREAYEPVGVSKLREITRLDPKGTYFNKETKINESLAEHIVSMVRNANAGSTFKQIEGQVRRLLGLDGPNAMVIRSFSVTQACWDEVISPALELARKLLGSKGRDSEGNAIEYSDGVCYEALASNYLNDPNNKPEPVNQEREKVKPLAIPMEV